MALVIPEDLIQKLKDFKNVRQIIGRLSLCRAYNCTTGLMHVYSKKEVIAR